MPRTNWILNPAWRRSLAISLTLVATLVLAIMPAASSAAGEWVAGPGASGDNTYTGYVDSPAAGASVAGGSAFLLTGWVVDRTAQGWAGIDEIHVYNGLAGAGTFLAKASIGIPRTDVAGALGNGGFTNSGFSASIAANAIPSGTRTLSVYAHTPNKGWWYTQVSINVTGTSAAPGSSAPTASSSSPVVVMEKPIFGEKLYSQLPPHWVYEMAGYAYDPSATPSQGVQGSGITKVQLYVNGNYITDATMGFHNDVAAGVSQQFAASGWRLRIAPTNCTSGNAQIEVRVTSAVTGKVTSLPSTIEIVDAAPAELTYPYTGTE